MTISKTFALVACLPALLALTSCTSVDSKPEPSSTAQIQTQPTEQTWGEEADANTLEDTPFGFSYVDRDGPDGGGSYGWNAVANDETRPAEITGDGIYILFHVGFQSVPRTIVDAYVATDPEGNERGPALDCGPGQYIPPGEFDPVFDPDSFDCIAAFKDPDYSTGTYYGVIVSKPASDEQASYGPKTTILPAYTRPAE